MFTLESRVRPADGFTGGSDDPGGGYAIGMPGRVYLEESRRKYSCKSLFLQRFDGLTEEAWRALEASGGVEFFSAQLKILPGKSCLRD